MSVSKSDKEFWTKKLQGAINSRIEGIAYTTSPNIITRAKEIAKQKVLANCGATDIYKSYQDTLEKMGRLDEERAVLRELSSDQCEQLRIALATEDSDRYNTFDRILDRMTRGEFRIDLAGLGPKGQQIVQLMNQRDNIELQIMLATSSKALVDLVQDICATLGIGLSGEAEEE